MDTFGFLVHPEDTADVAKKFPSLQNWSPAVLERLMRFGPPIFCGHSAGIRSDHNEVEGVFVATTLTARQMLELPLQTVLRKIIRAGRRAERAGAKILGLGAFTSVVGDAGITIAKNLRIPVTTGNSLTVATAIQATRQAAVLMDIEPSRAHLAVIGATGSIGAICARMLAPHVGKLTLVARDEAKLEQLASYIMSESGKTVNVSTDPRHTVRKAELVVTVTGSADTVLYPEDLRPGSVVCDVARPRDVAKTVALQRPDVLVIEGGLVEVPGEYESKFRFGLPKGVVFACMAETMILALEKRYECFTLGRNIRVEQVRQIDELARKHGFKLAGFRSFGKQLTPEMIREIRKVSAPTGSKKGKAVKAKRS
ncbi:shikimate dehydrogenase [Effusibacillus lacus]|uniref:Shikimate dehydrogenase n=1 Tax=Effusibacillus lacus TaxID=1348429 RepID=A0A292YJ13_9BACL|nr:shikimate dehydrogenase [Effusibacillus lacus]TCS70075.1 putative amino acid dehydrogenase [Effusibacillus lacus]GAX91087.1 shikimate dehydrogenase [Effusibacillus lacus]